MKLRSVAGRMTTSLTHLRNVLLSQNLSTGRPHPDADASDLPEGEVKKTTLIHPPRGRVGRESGRGGDEE